MTISASFSALGACARILALGLAELHERKLAAPREPLADLQARRACRAVDKNTRTHIFHRTLPDLVGVVPAQTSLLKHSYLEFAMIQLGTPPADACWHCMWG